MPGWQASTNGKRAKIAQDDGIFQALVLPAGRSQVHYEFAPPYIGFGWVAALAGLAGLLRLLWSVILTGRTVEPQPG